MATITINSQDFFSYGTQTEADIYFSGSVNFSTWDSFTDLEKERSLIESSRLLDRQSYKDGCDTQALREVNDNIIQACYEIAFLLVQGETDILESGSTFDETKRLKAGSVEVENFRSFSSLDAPKRFPQKINELLKSCLLSSGGASGLSGSYSFGTDKQTKAFDTWGYSH